MAIVWTPKARAVLDTASELFYDRGITAVGVDEIAERSGVTKKTLYDRFGSKERLIVEYLTDRDRQWREFLERFLTEADTSPTAQLQAVFDAAAAWSVTRGGKGCAMINAHAEISDPSHPAYAVILGQKRWMLDMFSEFATAAGHREPGRSGGQMMMLHEGAVVTAGMGLTDDAFAHAATAAVAILTSELAQQPPRRSRRRHARSSRSE
jgi:AcrR family transcriptional regulator